MKIKLAIFAMLQSKADRHPKFKKSLLNKLHPAV